MPKISWIRLAARPWRNARMRGTPPQTAASKATSTSLAAAAVRTSLPCRASRALLAVTTCFLQEMASRTKSRATSVPPMSSTTMSISGSSRMSRSREVRLSGSKGAWRRRSGSRSAAFFRTSSVPKRRARKSRRSLNSRATPWPTVPRPMSPTLTNRLFLFLIFLGDDFDFFRGHAYHFP